MTEVIVWTVIFLGGDLAVMVTLTAIAINKDKQKAQADSLGAG